MNNVVTIIVAVFASTGFWTFANKLLERNAKGLTPADEMILALGRDKLLTLNHKYRKQGYIPEEEMGMYTSLYDAYVGMGGNSQVKAGYEKNKSLPILSESEVDALEADK